MSRIGGEDFFVFDGWSVNKGYHHHHERNQATYIGVENTKTGKRKIFKTMMLSGTADQDIHYNYHGSYRRCANNEYRVEAGSSGGCNMDYQMTRFRAYIPLNEMFGDREDSEWRFYIIKNIDGHLVYDTLILPYSHDGFNWNDGQLTLDSGRNINRLVITQDNSVIKREKARGTSDLGRFRTTHNPFTKVAENETIGVANWYGVRDKANVSNGRTVWTSSVYWQFGGDIATLRYKRTKFDVTIRHIDASTNNETVLETQVREGLSGTHTFHPYSRDKFKNGVGYKLVPVDSSKTVNVNRDMRIDFRYKASLPDPTRIVEVGGGENTHGHAEGEALWELFKGERSVDLPDNVGEM